MGTALGRVRNARKFSGHIAWHQQPIRNERVFGKEFSFDRKLNVLSTPSDVGGVVRSHEKICACRTHYLCYNRFRFRGKNMRTPKHSTTIPINYLYRHRFLRTLRKSWNAAGASTSAS